MGRAKMLSHARRAVPCRLQARNGSWMKWHRLSCAVLVLLLPCACWAQDAARHVHSDAGNIFMERGGKKTKLTTSEMDVDPVLAPGGAIVVYTRQGRGRSVRGYDVGQICTVDPRPDELRQINADGTGDEHFLMPANDVLVLSFCPNKYKDNLVALSHRNFLLGGGYDWYWLYDP